MNIGTAHQKIIKDKKITENCSTPFSDDSIKRAICKDISREEAKSVIMEYEWLGDFGISRYYYGMYIDQVLVCVVCFGQTGARKDKYINYVGEDYANKGIQIVRGASTEIAPKHASSKLIGYALKQIDALGYKYVVAFSDPMANEIGTVYQATNWYYTGASTDNKGKERKHYNMIIDGTKYHLRTVVSVFGTSKKSELINRGYSIEYEHLLPKGRYFYLLGSKTDKKNMLKYLTKFMKPYPKRGQ